METICLILEESEGGEIWRMDHLFDTGRDRRWEIWRLDGGHLFDTGGVRGGGEIWRLDEDHLFDTGGVRGGEIWRLNGDHLFDTG